MILSDEDKQILRDHYTKVQTKRHAEAVELFKGDDFYAMNRNSFIRSSCRDVELGNELTIPEIQEEHDKFVASLSENERVKSYTVSSYCTCDYGCNGENELSLDFVVYTISHDIESSVKCSLGYTIRSFEFKYVHQRNGKDTLNYLAMFERIGIDTTKF